jgi:hypothetical protein
LANDGQFSTPDSTQDSTRKTWRRMTATSNDEASARSTQGGARHNRVLRATVIFFANLSDSAPRVDERDRIEVFNLGAGCYEIVSRHGFVERPNLPHLLASLDGETAVPAYSAIGILSQNARRFPASRRSDARLPARTDASRARAAVRRDGVSFGVERRM